MSEMTLENIDTLNIAWVHSGSKIWFVEEEIVLLELYVWGGGRDLLNLVVGLGGEN